MKPPETHTESIASSVNQIMKENKNLFIQKIISGQGISMVFIKIWKKQGY